MSSFAQDTILRSSDDGIEDVVVLVNTSSDHLSTSEEDIDNYGEHVDEVVSGVAPTKCS